MPLRKNGLLMNRRRFLANTSMALATVAGSSVIGASRRAWGRPTAEEIVTVKTAYGQLRGKRSGDLITFKGIPYAGSVSGENRFKAPPALQPWTGVRDAFTPGPPCASSLLRKNRTVSF
jgi:para-nitrobenzyl esterase